MNNNSFLIRISLFIICLYSIQGCKKKDDNVSLSTITELDPNWTKMNGPYGDITEFAGRNDTVFAGTYSGSLLRSVDYGITWKKIQTGLEGQKIEHVHLIEDKILVVTDYSVNGFMIYLSSDDGLSWQNLPISTGSGPDPVEIMGSKIFVVSSGLINRSTDYGQTWLSAFAGIPSFATVNKLCHYDNDLYAATIAGVYYSQDFGTSWTSIPGLGGPINTLFVDSLNIYCGLFTGMMVSAKNNLSWSSFTPGSWNIDKIFIEGNDWYIAGKSNLFVSHNMGVQWFFAGSVFESFIVSGTNLIGKTSSGNVLFSSDHSHTWDSKKISNHSIHSVLSFGNEIYVTSIGGSLFKSLDYGQNWGFITNDGSKTFLTKDGMTIYRCVENYSEIYSSVNGGNWTLSNNSGLWDISAFSAHGLIHVAGSGGHGGMQVTINGGSTWTDLNSANGVPSNISVNTIEFIFPYFYVGSNGSGVYRSVGAYNWIQCNTGINSLNSYAFIDVDSTTFVSTGDGIYKSVDLGLHWTKSSDGLPQGSIFNSFAVMESAIYVSSPIAGVYVSKNSGKSWNKDDEYLNEIAVSGIAIHDSYLFAGGEGVWRKEVK